MKRNLQAYGTDKFDIVGVNLDQSLERMNKYVEENDLPWVNLISDKEAEMSWDNPMANYYGIMGIPSAILVDQKGNVVSLRARGKELDRLLLELIGEPPNTPDDDTNNETDGETDGDTDGEGVADADASAEADSDADATGKDAKE